MNQMQTEGLSRGLTVTMVRKSQKDTDPELWV